MEVSARMEVSADPDRVAALQTQLIDEIDPLRRAAVHFELATLALSAGQFDSAARHFREALLLDATFDRARAGLLSLGATRAQPRERRAGVRGWLDRLRKRP